MEDADQRKLFVGGISWDTTEDSLSDHFGRFGTVVGSVVARDRVSGNPRGFAFVSFSDPSEADRALQEAHEILGRTVDVKKAKPRGEQNQSQQQFGRGLNRQSKTNGRSHDQCRTKKIFVGGLSASLTQDEFKSYFERFGRITDVVVMHDSLTQKPRGFGFITFYSEDSVEEVMQNSYHELSGKLVEVKRAVPKEGSTSSWNSYNSSVGNGASNFSTYQPGSYSPYGPRFAYYPGFGPSIGFGGITGYPYGPGSVAGGYPSGGLFYGTAPVSPRNPWNGAAAVGLWGNMLPYSSAPAFPGYPNGGLMNVAANNDSLGTGVYAQSGRLANGDESVNGSMSTKAHGEILDGKSFSSGESSTAAVAAGEQNRRDSGDQSNDNSS